MKADAEIFAAARHALDATPAVPATVRLHVDHGVVTLTGSVRLTSEQRAAAEVVGRIPGVRRIVNDIFVAELPSVQGFERPATE
jgi:osmotically-inducible protein OsmY